MPKELQNLTHLEQLFLNGNDELEKPSECPLSRGGIMAYQSKDEVSAFLSCLA